MLKFRVVIWSAFSMVWLWSVLAEAELPAAEAPESGPPVVQEEPYGVVIEEIPKGSTLKRAGLQVGDVITAWKRLPNPPANLEAAEGAMVSYFDWQDLEVEQAPRGTVVLRGRRGSEPLELIVIPGLWDANVRPVLPKRLEAIYAPGKGYFDSGDLDAAVKTWTLLLERSGSEGREDLRAWVALRLGKCWGEMGKWGNAVDSFRNAIGVTQIPSVQIVIWGVLGNAHVALNQRQEAENAHAAALAARQKINPEGLGVAFSLSRLGSVAFRSGDLDRARDFHLRSLRIKEQYAPRSLTLAFSLHNLGAEATERGNLSEASDYYLRALQIREELAPQSLDFAESLNGLGIVAAYRGDLYVASSYYRQALEIRERLDPDSLRVAQSLGNLASVASLLGDLDNAYDYHIRALQIRERLAPQSQEIAYSLSGLGTLEIRRGDFSRAEKYILRAFQIRHQLAPESLVTADTLNSLGALAHGRGDLSQAHDYHLQAFQINKKIAPESRYMASTLNNLGVLAQARGDMLDARNFHLQSLRIKEELAPMSLSMGLTLDSLGWIDQTLGNSTNARDYLLQALHIQEKLAPHSLDLARTLNHLGGVAQAEADWNSAQNFYGRALNTLDYQISRLGGSYRVQADFRNQHRRYYFSLLDLLLSRDHFPHAFNILERFRAQTFLTMLAERDVAFTADISDGLDRERRRIGALYDRNLKKLAGLNPRDHGEEIETIRKDLQKLDDEAGDLEARIRSASPKLAALRYPQPLDVASAQQALDVGTLLVSFSVGKDQTTLFALSREGALEVKTLPVGEETLRTRVQQLLNLLLKAEQGSSVGELRKHRVETIGRELYATLLGPVGNRIATSERLLILPDGLLHALPFAALVRDTKDGPQSLAAWKPLHVALSATVYAELKQRRRPASNQDALDAPLQLAAFGDPIYPQSFKTLNISGHVLSAEGAISAGRGDPTVRGAAERGLFDFQPLPHTRREVLGIASLFPVGASRTFLGPEALEERIKSLDPETRILHLAAHGSVDEHLPSGSFVALTILEEASNDTGPQRDNGLLQVWEIFERVRLNADLVVLSACQTGLGEELGGEGLIGLTRAFQYAGARSVLASLWNVNDQATSELMIRFYKHLRSGLPKDQALQAAQQELIRGPIEVTNEKGEREIRDFSSPYYWAGFQLYGDWQ